MIKKLVKKTTREADIRTITNGVIIRTYNKNFDAVETYFKTMDEATNYLKKEFK